MCIGKTVVRAGVISALVGGVAVAVAGPDHIKALFHQARNNVRGAIDSNISDPVALRAQLKDLEGQYPKRIADVRGDLAELNEQYSQLERELAVSKKVVSMADTDLESMQAVLAKAEEAKTTGVAQVVKVRFDGDHSMSMDDAYGKANRVTQLRNAYSQRTSDIERDLGYLGQQKDRLTTLLDQLESEHAEFQTQLWALDRQVDAISRNDRMIELMQKRQATIENHSRYRAASLDQITAHLADIRAKQESKLQMFAQTSDSDNYEKAAKYLLDNEQAKSFKGKAAKPKAVEIGPSVIEIGPDTKPAAPATPAPEKGPIASR
jgi:predicted RNase H-like nuclease (RuvC/YqgF family)